MDQIIQFIAQKLRVSPQRAAQIWQSIVESTKAHGEDITKIPPADLMKFIDQLVTQTQAAQVQGAAPSQVDPAMEQQLMSLKK